MKVGVAVSSFRCTVSLLAPSSPFRHKIWLWIPWFVVCGSRRSVSALTVQSPFCRTTNPYHLTMAGQRLSVRRRTAIEALGEDEKEQSPAKKTKSTKQEKSEVTEDKKRKKSSKKGKSAKSAKASKADVENTTKVTVTKKPKAKAKAKSGVKGARKTAESEKSSPKKRAKKSEHQRLTKRDTLPKLWDAEKAKENGSYS